MEIENKILRQQTLLPAKGVSEHPSALATKVNTCPEIRWSISCIFTKSVELTLLC